jgi:hypothetical protein
MKDWPCARQAPRFRLDAEITVRSPKVGIARGWCHDLGTGGMCGNVSSVFSVGDELEIEVQLPKAKNNLRARAVVKHARGSKYGFEFKGLDTASRWLITEFGRAQHTSAYILSPNSGLSWALQRSLQQLGVSHVNNGCPKQEPDCPHIIVIDSDWPDFAEVISFLRSESAADARSVVIIAVITPCISASDAHRAGADLVLHKPLALERTRKLLELAYRIVARTPVEHERTPAPATKKFFAS